MELDGACLTCFQSSGLHLLNIKTAKNNVIEEVLRKHFWFTEFDGETICHSCWDQVNSFHRFYASVEELYQNRLVSAIVKSEPEVEDIEYQETGQEEYSNLDGDVEAANGIVGHIEGEYGSPQTNDDDEMEEDVQDVTDNTLEESSQPQHLTDDEYIRQHVKYFCKVCGEESSTFARFVSHSNYHDEDKTPFLQCCGEKYYLKNHLLEHVQSVNNKNSFCCITCDKNFGSENDLQNHLDDFHGTENQFECELCAEVLNSKYLYKLHMEDHEGSEQQKVWKCEQCNKVYASQSHLVQHINHCHARAPVYTCDVCFRGFRVKYWLEQHKSNHKTCLKARGMPRIVQRDVSAEELLMCQYCPQLFAINDQTALVEHLQSVHPEMKFACNSCNYVSRTSGALKSHKARNHGYLKDREPKFPCSYCPQKYDQRSKLEEHEAAIHVRVHAYSCQRCEKTFTTKAYWLRHRNHAHSDKRQRKPAKS